MTHSSHKPDRPQTELRSKNKLNAYPASGGSTAATACPKIQPHRHGDPDADFNEGAPFSSESSQFETEFSDWIAAQNNWVEKYGIPGADLLPW
jgi:hypothetical protein